ncbi:dihydropteroate synthase [Lentzea sp. NBRC 105346]|uniref:dihydropteroate synthase n=1 Tax=Lentzea sp. NBRC 105346 TaxID=3032205 RepID=UPI0024A58612|nr:dihydropteroate synthase [Lentzea sp. NBRC 105346]GLZ31921.1 dihydropteroate synthase [Lentzea sp. NBRC 105346]
MIELQFRGRTILRDRPLVMAIINRTPDSFYDKGATYAEDEAMEAVHRVVDEGADIVDIGGVKAGPGNLVDAEEEIRRVVPFIARVRAAYPDLIISSDTWRSEVGRLACAEGADLLNDTWAGTDPKLAEVAAEFQAGYVCSHTGGITPRTRPHRVTFPDIVGSVLAETTTKAEEVARLGVPRKGILIDPTHDFGKNTWHGLELLRRASELAASGWPVLMALSNKDFVGETLGVELHERVEGTLVATAIAAVQGAAVFRAHEVARTRRVLETVARLQEV